MTTREDRVKRRMRSACNVCHRGKLRCSGGTPCSSCHTSGRQCSYSLSDPLGRPRGGKNKRLDSGRPTQERQPSSANISEPPVDSSDESRRASDLDDERLHNQHIHLFHDLRQREERHQMPPRPRYPTLAHQTDLNFGKAWRGNAQAIGSSADLASLTDVIMAAESRPRTPQTRQMTGYYTDSHSTRDFTSLPRNDDNILVRVASAMDDIGMETNWQDLLQDSWVSDATSEVVQNKPQQWLGRESLSWSKTLDVGTEPCSLPIAGEAAGSTAADSSTSCTCIQTQTNLLGYLRDVERKVGINIPVGALLKATRRGLSAWSEVVQCDRVCLGRLPDEEAVILVALGLRKILRLFEAYSQPKSSTNELPMPLEALVSRTSSVASLTPSARLSSATCFAQRGEQGANLAIGEYLLQEDEETMVGDMLAFQNLNSIRRVLSVLLNKVTTCTWGPMGRRESDWEVVQEMLRKLTVVADLQGRALQRKQELNHR